MTAFEREVTPQDVGELIDLSVEGNKDTVSMAKSQQEGVAAIHNVLCNNPFAYLADEVGMGKTYQALALVALLWNDKPDARVLFVSPRQNLQQKWYDDYRRFFATNYRRRQRLGDDRVTSVLFGEPVHRPVVFHNLRSWTPSIGMPESIAPLVRHTSFMRPVFVTAVDKWDLDELWATTETRIKGWGLFDVARPRELSTDTASYTLNIAFARALNARLESAGGGSPYFDLVVVDEAQCLRNPNNQTNQVLFESLRGNVSKWLFMSATPAHGGPSDLPRILNHYPDCGEVIEPGLVDDLGAMQRALKGFMVRRQRRYRTRKPGATVAKHEYRRHATENWAVRDEEMSTLSTLAIGLVQKGLVDVLRARNNRYRIGFLSSFESLQSSLRRHAKKTDSEQPSDDDDPDFYRDSGDSNADEAPDAKFIERLDSDFTTRFGMPLPHPKLDAVVERVAPHAFGANGVMGGEKHLIFTRRVSTVDALCRRLALRHRKAVEERIKRCWNCTVDWSGRGAGAEDSQRVAGEDAEGFDPDPGEDPIRQAMGERGWLFRYRQTFRNAGRNSLFFEDAWLQRLCLAGGITPDDAAAAIPDEIWAESWRHASRTGGGQHRADRVRYLAVHAIGRCPQAFGLEPDTAAPWKESYERCLHGHVNQEFLQPGDNVNRNLALLKLPTLWTVWDEQFAGTELALPASNPRPGESTSVEALCERQVARTLLGQVFRLTDTLLDLYFADEAGERSADRLPDRFVRWLASGDAAAEQLQRECAQWLRHLRLIVDSSLDGAGRSWGDLAREETWPQLFNPRPVIGVTGGSGGHRVATRQFRTPSLPRVIVCTDTLKEGVDLHLFCDRVLHYGVAWTSGDMEQRVGRVDRYFSQIERRLVDDGAPPDVQLEVGYPHVVASLERSQVNRVVERQRTAERLMDSPLVGKDGEDREQVAGTNVPDGVKPRLEPYGRPSFPEHGRNVVHVSKTAATRTAEHYERWHREMLRWLRTAGWDATPSGWPEQRATLRAAANPEGLSGPHEIEWSFDAALGRYVVTLSSPPWPGSADFSGGERYRIVDRRRVIETYVRLLVPTPCEGVDIAGIDRLIEVLAGREPEPDHSARDSWGRALETVPNSEILWEAGYKARVRVVRAKRKHTVTLYAYDRSVRIVGVVAPIAELRSRDEWGGPASRAGLREWLLNENRMLPLGYVALHDRDGLVFGIHVLHGGLSTAARRDLVTEVAWRTDLREAALTGTDRR